VLSWIRCHPRRYYVAPELTPLMQALLAGSAGLSMRRCFSGYEGRQKTRLITVTVQVTGPLQSALGSKSPQAWNSGV
jgi:hypothetical protein